jgi:hypothetical protein
MKPAPTPAGASRVTRELTRASAPSKPLQLHHLLVPDVLASLCSTQPIRKLPRSQNQQTLFHLIFRPLASLRCHLSRWSWQREPSGSSTRAELPSCRRRSPALWFMHPAATERVPVDSAPCSLRRTEFCLCACPFSAISVIATLLPGAAMSHPFAISSRPRLARRSHLTCDCRAPETVASSGV